MRQVRKSQEIQRPQGAHRATPGGRGRVPWPARMGRLAMGGAVAGTLALAAGGTAGATTTTTAPGPGAFGHHGFGGRPQGFGGPSGGFAGPGGFGPGAGALGSSVAAAPAVGGQSVTAVGNGSLSVSGNGGTTRTFNTTSSTTYTIDGTPASASAVSVGSKVTVRTAFGPRNFPGGSGSSTTTTTAPVTPTAAAVNVVLPELTGTVSALNNGSITVTDAQGFWRTAKLAGTVTYLQSGEPATSSSVVMGSQVAAIGTVDANHTDLDTSIVDVILPVVTGKVTAVSGSTITIQPYTGSTTTTVETSTGTAFVTGGGPNAGPGSLGAIKTGDVISASGTKAADGTITAVKVTLFGAPGSGGGFPGAPGPNRSPAPPTTGS